MSMSCQDKPLRVLVAPDSYKGSLSAAAVAARIACGIREAMPDCVVVEVPIADGGEGSADVIARGLGGTWGEVEVVDANGCLVAVPYATCHSPVLGTFAVLDVAEIVGLPAALAAPGVRTTRGVGQAIRAIYARGVTTIALGLGGSSTNDAGAGLLAELAFLCRDKAGHDVAPVLDNLAHIVRIERRPDAGWLQDLQLIGLTDVTSPLNGAEGASFVFGPQKGVTDPAQADTALAHFAACCTSLLDHDWSRLDGSGAAGGLGFAVAVLGGALQPGAHFVLAAHRLTETMGDYDWVITGEGQSDQQTLLGKGPAEVARLARRSGVPVTLLSGSVEPSPDLEKVFNGGCFAIQPGPVSLAYAMQHADVLLQRASRQVAALFAQARTSTVNPPIDEV